ncbi:uncharacterized protein [Lolium perenne]|uniref:uncharacterized protein n=1 Tax=Lolium perenne TaxID=4522 RepID=UPI003A995BA5
MGNVHDLGSIREGLRQTMDKLQSWGKRKFGNVTRELNRMREHIKILLASGADSSVIREATYAMNELLYKEEMLWLQRSRIDWLREGDRNTMYFHQKAKWHARRNKITKLKDVGGAIKMVPSDMERTIMSFFKHLYTRGPTINGVPIIALTQELIDEDMNTKLCKDFSVKEISDALFQIGPLKAPGPDGFPARFYQRNWDIYHA